MCHLAAERVASCDQLGCVHIWSLQSGKKLHVFTPPRRVAARTVKVELGVGVYDLDSDEEIGGEQASSGGHVIGHATGRSES
jgi:hypothetical protein